MEKKKQGLKEELARVLSPLMSVGRNSCPFSLFPHRRMITNHAEFIPKSSTLKPVLAPLFEGPDQDLGSSGKSKSFVDGFFQWMKDQFFRLPYLKSVKNDSGNTKKRSHMRLLFGVMATPLAPVHVSMDPLPSITIKDTPIETCSVQYILQQYIGALGGQKIVNSIRNTYAMGKLKMVGLELESGTTNKVVKNRNVTETGGFILWQMNPDLWYVELALGANKVHAGSNGKLVWRHTPWFEAHAVKGPVRPLRRALQGLDPRIIANSFAHAGCMGEKEINGEHCFVLKLCVEPHALKARSEEGGTEMIRHVIFGYFSQKTGLLVYIEDSHLTRIQYDGSDALYCETMINSFLEDYRPIEGILIAHSGRSILTLDRFGDMAMNHTTARMEESWSIEEVAFNVPGLSMDCFIPPADLRSDSISEITQVN